MIKDKEVAIVNAASRALNIQRKVSDLPTEDIIKKIIPFLDAEGIKADAKIAAIAAVNGVINLKRRKENNNLTDKQIIEMWMKENKFEDE